MNVVREINKINDLELKLGVSGASWHDEYKDSAYIFIGGLHFELSEGDVITIFSQYGEVMDINMPRDKETGKPRGFAFLMYEDQRSTVLAVDNLNGSKVLEKTLRVDHVKNYKQPKVKGEDGEMEEPEEQSLNAKPQMIYDEEGSDSSEESGPDIDPEDPMREYLLAQWKEERAQKKSKKKSKDKHKDETPEERRARKARKKEKKARKNKSEGTKGKSDVFKGVEALLGSLSRREGEGGTDRRRSRSPSSRRRPRSRSPSPRSRHENTHKNASPRSRSPYDRRRRDRYDDHDRMEREPRRRGHGDSD
ncbi:hypothetical protein ONZ45_g11864 [Pleurotus djamor]|nr:hypothetical protein ONZ45_g11864 [Pleurotus djamor]